MTDVRTLVLAIPHWSTIAAGAAYDCPAAVMHMNRVVDATPFAVEQGVVPGTRRREAQRLCPDLEMIDDDEARNARRFHLIVTALESVTPRVETSTSGWCSFPTRGPSRYFGGDQNLARLAADRALRALCDTLGVAEVPSVIQPRVGVADSRFAACLAAFPKNLPFIRVVAPGASSEFLAPFPVDALGSKDSPLVDATDLIDVFRRLGLHTLGDVASVPADHLLARFGSPGLLAHRLSLGTDSRTPQTHLISDVVMEEIEIEPPTAHVETVVFLAKALADEIHRRLSGEGLACVRILIEVESEHDESCGRYWRHEHQFTPTAITDRVRWQLEGWGHSATGPTGRLSLVRLVVDEAVPDDGRQLGFWGGETPSDERVVRSLARIQGMLGSDAVTVVEHNEGRCLLDIEQRVSLAVAGFDPDRSIAIPEAMAAPWPGRLSAPLPAAVFQQAHQLIVTDVKGQPGRVNGRGQIGGEPAQVQGEPLGSHLIVGWAGPWFLDERWWDPARKRRQARFQLLLADGTAHLCVVKSEKWWLEASYE